MTTKLKGIFLERKPPVINLVFWCTGLSNTSIGGFPRRSYTFCHLNNLLQDSKLIVLQRDPKEIDIKIKPSMRSNAGKIQCKSCSTRIFLLVMELTPLSWYYKMIADSSYQYWLILMRELDLSSFIVKKYIYIIGQQPVATLFYNLYNDVAI